MAARKSFEEKVLAARAADRERYASALANTNGPAPYTKVANEDEQDQMWDHIDPEWADPQKAMLLVMPKELGGMGLTPLAASYVRRPFRKELIEGAGSTIDEQLAYAKHREKRRAEKQAAQPAPPPMAAPPMGQSPPAPTPPPTTPMASSPEPSIERGY